jgi:membrane protein implicated in regulation of membrane protease activity
MDKDDKSDQPLLNKREAQLVGRTATLEQPIKEGVRARAH